MANYRKRTDIKVNKFYSIGENRLLKITKIRTRLKAVMYERPEEGMLIELHSYAGTKMWLENKFVKEHKLSLNIIINQNKFLNVLEETQAKFNGKILGKPKYALIKSDMAVKSFEKFFRDRGWKKQAVEWPSDFGEGKEYFMEKKDIGIVFYAKTKKLFISDVK